jgi:hypothetical protein
VATAPLRVAWARGRLFDQRVTRLLRASVAAGGSLRVASVTTQDKVQARLEGLSALEMLQLD